MKFNAAPTSSCETLAYGEVEDYCINILDEYPESINEHLNDNIVVFPNPFNETISIKGMNADQSLEIIDVLGRMILRLEGNPETDISTAHFPGGLYHLNIKGKNGKTQKNLRLIKTQ